jgi:hypothetical protein
MKAMGSWSPSDPGLNEVGPDKRSGGPDRLMFNGKVSD